ncbi:MAG: pentapeptide repeat-containing protein [Bacteroidota bacterium]|nr:pentapeptide repeat-containing protein [Bacteroidota bacterium]
MRNGVSYHSRSQTPARLRLAGGEFGNEIYFFFYAKSMKSRTIKTIIEQQTFTGIDFSKNGFPKDDYENCSFLNCNLSNADLSGIKFIECTFRGCNLSVSKLDGTTFRDAHFVDCKLSGMQFGNCNEILFSVDFENCNLTLASFYALNVKKTRFKNCILHEVDFTQSDLSGSLFDNCDFARAKFDRTNLIKTDLRNSYNYSIDPEENKVKKAKFSAVGIIGLLGKYDIDVE